MITKSTQIITRSTASMSTETSNNKPRYKKAYTSFIKICLSVLTSTPSQSHVYGWCHQPIRLTYTNVYTKSHIYKRIQKSHIYKRILKSHIYKHILKSHINNILQNGICYNVKLLTKTLVHLMMWLFDLCKNHVQNSNPFNEVVR